MSGDSKKPSKKHVKREPCSTTTVTSSSTINEILRRYSIYTTQRQRHHGFWGKKTLYPQEDYFEHKIPKYCEPWPSLEASEESPALKDRGDGEGPFNMRVVQVVPLRCDSTPYGDPVQDIANDTVQNICNEDALYEITNEAAVHDTNQHAVQDICKKDAAKESFIVENDLIVESISDDEDFAAPYGDPVQDIANDTVQNICNEDALYEITNEAAVHDTNQHAVQDICKKDAAKESFIVENDLIVESISDDEDFAAPYGDPVQDIANDTVQNICNEDALYEITNEAAVHDTNQHAVQDICKKDAAKESFIVENDLIVESISDDEDL
ncbi:uncharacterized protein [Chlorocebus sabaeus]|uniref:uncharacterized protein isoform X2 n=1 Tax=Chlorocebus sabaeus TaxID=60711 RepID=UPI003BF9B672